MSNEQDHPYIESAVDKLTDGVDYAKEKLTDAKDSAFGTNADKEDIVQKIKDKACEAGEAIEHFTDEAEKKILDEA